VESLESKNVKEKKKRDANLLKEFLRNEKRTKSEKCPLYSQQNQTSTLRSLFALSDGENYVPPSLTLGRTSHSLPPSPIRFSLNFLKKNYHQDLLFSVAVRISLRHILTQVW